MNREDGTAARHLEQSHPETETEWRARGRGQGGHCPVGTGFQMCKMYKSCRYKTQRKERRALPVTAGPRAQELTWTVNRPHSAVTASW